MGEYSEKKGRGPKPTPLRNVAGRAKRTAGNPIPLHGTVMPSGIHENHAKGEQHYRARLTPDKVRQILASNDTTPALAKRFGVNSGTIHDVRVRRTWRHVGDQ